MLIGIGHYFPSSPLLVVTDSWFGNQSLWRQVRKVLGDRFHMLSRLRCNNVLYAQPDAQQSGQRGRRRKYGKHLGSVTDMAAEVRQQAKTYIVNLYSKRREVRAYDAVVMVKTLKCPVRVVWVFRKTQWVAMFTTDLELSVIQIIEYYGARWKIESGFKELKQDIGSRTSQCRNAQAVTNHLQFCLMASTITWIYIPRGQLFGFFKITGSSWSSSFASHF